jgi:DNA polymerase III epsilon subunit-like protein
MFTEFDKFIVVDTETTNSIDDPLCYDVGFAVVDKFGKVYEKHSYVVSDIFLDKELMSSAYFADKIPQYWEEIKHGDRCLRTFAFIKRKFAKVCKAHGVKIILAHNARFDYRSLNLTLRFLTSSKDRFFFPYGVEIWDTLKMSRKVLKEIQDYDEFCYNNNFLTKRLCKRYTAEIIYRFIINDLTFEESHTGLEDVLIEKEIFVFCLSHQPEIDGILWARER